jgi:hypothetical protein
MYYECEKEVGKDLKRKSPNIFGDISDLYGEIGRNLRCITKRNLVRFQVLTAASMKMTVFWVVALCSKHF